MDNFEFIENIDEGAFGIVQKAKNRKTDEIVAIKKIKKKYSSWDECMNLREVKSLRKLKHPNIIKLKEVFKQENNLYMVFEYAEKDLFKLYANNYKNIGIRMSESEIRNLVYQIVKGLAFMHKNGYFHRDLKPENILVTDSGQVKIADLGLAREIRSSPPYTEYVSTRWYRAPEILLKSTSYNSPVDIFSLGCIMAELYNQQPLFNGNSEIDQLQKICKVLGTPSRSWQEGYKLVGQLGFEFPTYDPMPLESILTTANSQTIDLLKSMLKFDNSKRITAVSMLNHPYFNQCKDGSSNNDIAKESFQQRNDIEMNRKIENAVNKSKESLSDDIDFLLNDYHKNTDNIFKPKRGSFDKFQSAINTRQLLKYQDNYRGDIKLSADLDSDLFDKIIYDNESSTAKKQVENEPRQKNESNKKYGDYESPKHNDIELSHYREGTSAMKMNTRNILNKNKTPKKETDFNIYLSSTQKPNLSNYQSVKDKKDRFLEDKTQPLSYSSKKPAYEEKLNQFQYDISELDSLKGKTKKGTSNNLNLIDDQIDELLHSSNKKKPINKIYLEKKADPSFVSSIIKNLPIDSKTSNIYKMYEKENLKTLQGPSYLNGITIMQNFEKPSLN